METGLEQDGVSATAAAGQALGPAIANSEPPAPVTAATITSPAAPLFDPGTALVNQHDIICLGGTFDHLHAGHKVLLTVAALWSRKTVMCGVTAPSMLTKKVCGQYVEPYQVRCDHVCQLVQRVRRHIGCQTVEIADGFGNTTSIRDLTALVASSETLAGAELINQERRAKDYPPLAIYPISLVASQAQPDAAASVAKLSSTLIRQFLASQEQDFSLFASVQQKI